MIALRRDILVTPIERTMVTTAASPSGIAATAKLIASINVPIMELNENLFEEYMPKEIDEELAPFLIKNVTSDKCPPWVLKTRYGMEAGEKRFNLKRRQFYYLLAVKKQII